MCEKMDHADVEEDLNITIINIEDELCIKPPDSFMSLLDIAQEKFQTFQMKFTYVNENSYLTPILGEDDYQQSILFAKLNKLGNLQIFVEGTDKPNRRRTSSFKKITKMAVKNNVQSYQFKDSNGCVNDDMNEENGDLRNLKYNSELMDTKHSHNKNDQARIYYIKEKKQMIRDEQLQRENEKKQKKEKEQADAGEMDFGKRKTKKKKRGDDDD